MTAPSSEGFPGTPGEQPGLLPGQDRASMPWRRMFSFVALPLISLISPLVLIPVIASVGGATGWAAVALGTALGGVASTVLQFGWGFTGPTLLAPLPAGERARLLWISTLSRLVVASVVCPVAAVLAAVLAPEGQAVLAAATAVAFSTFGLSALWYFVGTGRAGLAARYETVPRLVVLLVAALAVLLTGEALWYPVIFLAGQVLAIGWLTHRLSDVSFSRGAWSAAVGALRTQRTAAGTDAVVVLSQSVPLSILAGVAPGALAVFAAGDRVQKLGQSGIQPLFNAFQGWVAEAPGSEVRGRMRLAVATTATAGAVAGLLLAVGLPLLDDVLFAGEVSVTPAVSVWFGIGLALYSLTSSVNFSVLAPAGRTGPIFRSMAVGGVIAVIGVALLSHWFGAPGGAASVVIAQAAILAVQVPEWRKVGSVEAGSVAPERRNMTTAAVC